MSAQANDEFGSRPLSNNRSEFDEFGSRPLPAKEGYERTEARYANALPRGLVTLATGPLALLQTAAATESLQELEDLEERFPGMINREKYLEAVQQAAGGIPTGQNIAEFVERKTGAPVAARTRGQRAADLAVQAAVSPGSLPQRAASAAITPAISLGAQELGVPEPLAELAALPAGAIAPRLAKSATQIAKPSGLTARRFENVTKPTKISKGRAGVIQEKVENDFRKIAEDIHIEHAPIYSEWKNNPKLKRDISEGFSKVEELADQLPDRISLDSVLNSYNNRVGSRETKGYVPSAYEKALKSEESKVRTDLIRAAGKTPEGIMAKTAVKQYRKTNGDVADSFGPGKTSAENRAVRDAKLDHNRALADSMREVYGDDSPFVQLFDKQNKYWTDLSNLEQVDEFVDKLFSGKVNFKEARNYFAGESQDARAVRNLLGKEGTQKFETLLGDLLTQEKGLSLLKAARDAGHQDLALMAGAYIFDPKIAGAKYGANLVKRLYQYALDKPQITVEWKKGIDLMKDGKWAAAQTAFNNVEHQITQLQQESQK